VSHTLRAAIVLLSTVVVCASRPTAQATRLGPQSIPQWLDRYERGDYDAVLTEVYATPDIKAFGKQLTDLAPRWVSAQGPDAVDRRRLVAAAFTLEAIKPAMERVLPTPGSPEAAPILEWACQLLRSTPSALPAERWWHLAAVALIQRSWNDYLTGEIDPRITRTAEYGPVRNHLGHSVNRFPDEPRFRLAAVVSKEVHITGGAWFWLSQPPTSAAFVDAHAQFDGPEAQKREAAALREHDAARRRVLAQYAALATTEGIRAEVHLRAGVLEFRLGDHDMALG